MKNKTSFVQAVLRACAVSVVFLFTAMTGFAQFDAATVLGSVRDATGAVMPGVTVTLKNIDTGIAASAQTDGDGNYQFNNVTPDANDAWSWGMWMVYLRNEDVVRIQSWFDAAGSSPSHIHTSGHASPADLRKFAMSMKAKTMVPIHGLAWDSALEGFPPITRLQDNEPLRL